MTEQNNTMQQGQVTLNSNAQKQTIPACLACNKGCCGFQRRLGIGPQFENCSTVAHIHGFTTKKRWRRGCPGQVSWVVAREPPPLPAIVLDPWPFHSPPPPQKCSAVASPSGPSPPPSLDTRRAARVRPEIRQWRGRRPETPVGNLSSSGSVSSPIAQLSPSPVCCRAQQTTGSCTAQQTTGSCTEAGSLGVLWLRNPQKPGTQSNGSACGEVRRASQTRAPPSGTSSLSHPEARSAADRHFTAEAGIASCLVLMLLHGGKKTSLRPRGYSLREMLLLRPGATWCLRAADLLGRRQQPGARSWKLTFLDDRDNAFSTMVTSVPCRVPEAQQAFSEGWKGEWTHHYWFLIKIIE